ncbi:hypothetical protein Mapa_002758 [Marchantia paleacea]|nr:hypothetical protein Mapa_002758 [Marchantia paleacea]
MDPRRRAKQSRGLPDLSTRHCEFDRSSEMNYQIRSIIHPPANDVEGFVIGCTKIYRGTDGRCSCEGSRGRLGSGIFRNYLCGFSSCTSQDLQQFVNQVV